MKATKDVQPAPKWLVDRMEALKRMPPPTLEEVETSFRAGEKWRRENVMDTPRT